MLLTRIAKFSAVGVVNTAIDFLIFNLLTSRRVRMGKIQANLISTTCAMVFSFFANQRYVFEAQGGNFWAQALEFYAVTAVGLYVLQNIVIFVMTKRAAWLQQFILSVAGLLSLRRRLSDDFIIKNSAKLTATAVSLVWNFVMFQTVVFKQ